MQTILGSGGGIGIPLAKELIKYTDKIRLVSRNPVRINETDEIMSVDFNELNQIDKAIEGSDVVYVVVGFEYKISVWKKQWPPFIKEVIDSCKMHNVKLVFFDNIYMYSKESVKQMTESSAINPPSKKGEIRKLVQDIVMNEIENNDIDVIIARAADFYGPDNKNSMLTISVVKNLINGKRAQYFGDLDKIHTYTFTPDAARATAFLGNTEKAYNQVWHLPTTSQAITQIDWINLISEELNVEPRTQKIPLWMLRILGLFIPVLKEFPEMLYQYENDYYFDSSKIERTFGIKPTDPKTGIRELIKSIKLSD